MVHSILLGFILLAISAALTLAADFYQLPGRFSFISAKGDELWGIDKNRKVHRFDFTNGKWKQISNEGITRGQPDTIGASPDGFSYLSTNTGPWKSGDTTNVFRYNPSLQKWESVCGVLQQVNSVSKDIVVGTSGGAAWGKYTGGLTDFTGKMIVIAGAKPALWTAVGEDNEHWIIEGGTKRMYRSNDEGTKAWIMVPGVTAARDQATSGVRGAAATLDVQNAKRVVMTSDTGRVYMWNGEDWNQLPIENAAQATIGNNRVFILDETEKVIMADI